MIPVASRLLFPLAAALIVCTLSACSTLSESEPDRTASEQLLFSAAAASRAW